MATTYAQWIDEQEAIGVKHVVARGEHYALVSDEATTWATPWSAWCAAMEAEVWGHDDEQRYAHLAERCPVVTDEQRADLAAAGFELQLG